MVERGFDEHHIIEAGFKALGMSLRKATIPRAALLSTKDKPKTRRK
jgi:imidazoleglycerol phosphate dehydratase HisB